MHTKQTATVGKVLRQPAVRSQESGRSPGHASFPLPQARLLGHQCPLETVSVGSEGAVSHRRLWRERSLKYNSTRAAHGKTAWRISKHLFGGGSGGLVGYGRGEGNLGGVQSAPFLAQGRATLRNLKLPGGVRNAD